MPQGLVVYDSASNVVFDTTNFLATFVKKYDNVSTNGSDTIAGLTGYGTPFAFILPTISYGFTVFNVPIVTFAGNTVTWTYTTKSGGTNITCSIFIGVR